MCFTPLEGGGGWGRRGGWTFKSVPLSQLVEEKGHFLTQKESACQISADSEQLEKSQRNRYLRLPYTEPFNFLPKCGMNVQAFSWGLRMLPWENFEFTINPGLWGHSSLPRVRSRILHWSWVEERVRVSSKGGVGGRVPRILDWSKIQNPQLQNIAA